MTGEAAAPLEPTLLQQLEALPDHLTGEIIVGEWVVSPRPRGRSPRS